MNYFTQNTNFNCFINSKSIRNPNKCDYSLTMQGRPLTGANSFTKMGLRNLGTQNIYIFNLYNAWKIGLYTSKALIVSVISR